MPAAVCGKFKWLMNALLPIGRPAVEPLVPLKEQ